MGQRWQQSSPVLGSDQTRPWTSSPGTGMVWTGLGPTGTCSVLNRPVRRPGRQCRPSSYWDGRDGAKSVRPVLAYK